MAYVPGMPSDKLAKGGQADLEHWLGNSVNVCLAESACHKRSTSAVRCATAWCIADVFYLWHDKLEVTETKMCSKLHGRRALFLAGI